MRLKNYNVGGNFVLVEVKEYKTTATGIIQVSPTSEKVMKVLKVGGSVQYKVAYSSTRVDGGEAGLRILQPGDFVLLGGAPMPQFEFEPHGDQKEKIIAVQTTEFNILGAYTPDEDETRFWTVHTKSDSSEESRRELNVIDNPGIEHGSYLKEEEKNKEGELFINR